MTTIRVTVGIALLSAVIGTSAEAQVKPPAASAATSPDALASCRTTALATEPELFAADADGSSTRPAQYLERFFVAVDCTRSKTSGDYQIWWKASLASPPNSARLVAILDDQTETCERVFGCFAAGREFDFAIEVNSWRMTPGCYGVRAIFGEAVDEYWQCTRPLVFTLNKSTGTPR